MDNNYQDPNNGYNQPPQQPEYQPQPQQPVYQDYQQPQQPVYQDYQQPQPYQQPQQPMYQQQYQQPQQPMYQQPGYVPQPAGSPPGKGAAIAALVLGIVSLGIMWIPVLNYISIVTAIIGVVLGVVAQKKLTPDTGRGMATAGLVCSIIALALSLVVVISCSICAAQTCGAARWMF